MTEEERAEQETGKTDKSKRKSKNKFKVQDSEITSTSEQSASNNLGFLNSVPKTRKYLLIKTGRKWHDQQVRIATNGQTHHWL